MKRGLTALAVATALVAVPLAVADANFTDASGDANGAPDVVGVQVANDATNRVAFEIELGGKQILPDDSIATVLIDSDQNLDTGSGGWDYYAVVASDGSSVLLRWDGTQWTESPSTSARAWIAAGYVVYGINRSELGESANFDFVVAGAKLAGEEIVAQDFAPSADDYWSYSSVAKTYGLVAMPLLITSKLPSVSTKVVVSLVTFRSDSLEPLTDYKTTCTIMVGGKRISTVVSGRDGVSDCVSARLPQSAKGKLLKLTMTTTAGGKSVSKTWSAKVGA